MRPKRGRTALLQLGTGVLVASLLAVFVPALVAAQEDASLDRIKERGRLELCADKYALPFSNHDPEMPGLDNEIAVEIARRLDVRAEFIWLDTRRGRGAMRRMILTKECDCVVGLPVKKATEMELESTRPYLGTCFALVMREGGKRVETVEELDGMQVGAPVNSPPWRVLNDRGWNPSSGYRYGWEILKAVDSGELDAGFVWAPSGGWYLLNHPELRVELIQANVMLPQFRWNTGVALRPGEIALREAIDLILVEIEEDGMVERLASKYGIPYFPPFELGKE